MNPGLGSRGSALPVVLLFAAVGLISVFTYFFHQLTIAKPALRSPAAVQALLNARSGIYKSFELLTGSKDQFADTLKTISTLDSLFGKELIEVPAGSFELSSTPSELNLFDSDSFGNCEVSLFPQGIFFTLKSTGRFRGFERHITARLGNKLPALPDTVLIYYNKNPWEGKEPDGKRIQMNDTTPEPSSPLLSKLLSEYQSQLQIMDTAIFNPPLTIQANSDLKKIPDHIDGPLFIDGSYIGIEWKDNRIITVLGDLQFTGEVIVDGLSFIVAGEIKLLDNSELINASLFSQSRIFMGDNARFQGDALASRSISVYGKAAVYGKSTLAAAGRSSQDTLPYSIFLSEQATVDAVCMALFNPGGIKTDEDVEITGILWAQNTICHRGSMRGLIRAGVVIDCDKQEQSTAPGDSSQNKKSVSFNSLPGSLSPLGSITEYKMPSFSGSPSIIDWKEN